MFLYPDPWVHVTKGISELLEGNYFCIRVDELWSETDKNLGPVRGLLASLVIWRQMSMMFSQLYATKTIMYPEKESYKSIITSFHDDSFV